MSAAYCPRCGIDSIRNNVCTDPACAYPEVRGA